MDDLKTWRAARLKALTAPDGWLNLTDRIEFGPGRHSVGSDEICDLRLSCGPGFLGWLIDLPGQKTAFQCATGERKNFKSTKGSPPRTKAAPFLLEIHLVGDKPALRVRWTADRPGYKFAGLRYFPTEPDWVITARWEKLAEPVALQVDMISGAVETVLQTYVARFHREGHDIALVPTHAKAGKPMFVIRDATSGHMTYAASRFLIGEVLDDHIILDFNRAHTPPCGFTDFAICPLPPPENRLPFAVRAGELAP